MFIITPVIKPHADLQKKLPSDHKLREAHIITSQHTAFVDVLPAEHTQHKVQHKKRAQNDQTNKVDPRGLPANGVIHLYKGPNKTVNPKGETKMKPRETPVTRLRSLLWGERREGENGEEKRGAAHPLKTPRTRFRTKKEPKMTKLTKYTHGSSRPIASFI